MNIEEILIKQYGKNYDPLSITELYCSNNKLESLKGIETLTNLTDL
jgi:Leucine-rich repeat (LRR) protein